MAALSLSSLAAFELQDAGYKGTLLAHFCPDILGGKVENLEQFLWQYRQDNSNEVVDTHCPLLYISVDYDEYDWETESFKTITTPCIPLDLWRGLLQECDIAYGSTWGKISPKKCRKLAEAVVGSSFQVGDRNKDYAYPFINAGGITLREIDMSTMESKVVDGLFCCGQVLDGDASHNCFSLMKSFVTGKMAGENAFRYVRRRHDLKDKIT
jgi:predicted flavoprotein YhiN